MIKIIGAGLGRTGTMSLKLALEALGYNRCYHMSELLNDPSRLKYWKEFQKSGKTSYDDLFDGYMAAVDYPAAALYKDLYRQIPGCKVILTVRDPEEWYESVKRTIYSVSPKSFKEIASLIYRAMTNKNVRRVGPVFQLNDRLIWKKQFQGKFKDKAFAMDRFHQWNEEVINTIPEEDLLVMKISDGWEPLCAFLNKEVPKIEFPLSNKRQDFKQKVDNLFQEGRIPM